MAQCFRDYRDQRWVEHTVEELLGQRLFGFCLGYEDLNDHDQLRTDPMLAVAVGKADPLGMNRLREEDRGKALAGKSTLNRLELSKAGAIDKYKKILMQESEIDAWIVRAFVDAHATAPEEIVLDLDATDDLIHGNQEGKFFHGYYGNYCYLPLYIFSGEHLLCARLRRSSTAEVETLLVGLLGSSRSINAAKDALQKMGLSSSEQDLERVAAGLIEELELRNSRPLDPDMLAVFVDGKYIELRESDKLRSACIYLVIGLGRDGKKRVLSCIVKPGRENLEDWKTVLRGLVERGLRRVMIFIQDDFSGLQPISQGFFPNADIQLCAVHMQRNAITHLFKTDASEFQQRWRAIKASWDVEVGNASLRSFATVSLRPIPHGSASFAKNVPTTWPS